MWEDWESESGYRGNRYKVNRYEESRYTGGGRSKKRGKRRRRRKEAAGLKNAEKGEGGGEGTEF